MLDYSIVIMNIIEQLRSTNSRLEKEKILQDIKDKDDMTNVKFVMFLHNVYCRDFNYWYSSKAVINNATNIQTSVFPKKEREEIELRRVNNPSYQNYDFGQPWVSNVLELIRNRDVTGHEGLNLLTKLYLILNDKSRELLIMILDRDIRAGVTNTTFAKIWTDNKAFQDFKVMLCHKFDEKTKPKKYPVYVQLKYDASRIIIFVNELYVTYRTRNGKFYDIQNPELDKEFIEIYKSISAGYPELKNGIVFDGEIYQVDYNTMRPKSRQVSNGVATKLIKSTASKQEQQDIGITLWDCVAYKDFQAGLSKIPYYVRLNQLKIPFTYQPDKFNHIFLVENKVCRNEEEILTTAEKLIAQGEEGVIVKDINGIWENKRSKFALKIKDENEADLLVTDVIEGTGKYKGQIGSLICQSSDGNVKVSVGSGLTDDDRKKQPSEFIGRIIAVKYNMIIDNASKNGKTLFLPRFVEIREDKDIADTL